jgi:hypothetical protein
MAISGRTWAGKSLRQSSVQGTCLGDTVLTGSASYIAIYVQTVRGLNDRGCLEAASVGFVNACQRQLIRERSNRAAELSEALFPSL